ncbi:helix-turn-helix domain-containing protein [Anaeromyxobacter oryzae]|uniref:Helix-turn-helix domain-containing protein n=1 Tax=Anaeromyxobacter oryzae TaxID=2918170 RepID=A0ABM7WTJ5_9BACT|nr:helix-turn-helix domain-containing protein [Anaeromyxobacter oryzae]BDG02805.1 hypothetical protein AMOR_18010 [Anaeromyxobacter oryzae]
MPAPTPPPSWTCQICALGQEILYRPPTSPDARCAACGDAPQGCEMLRFDVAALRHAVEELKTRLLRAELPSREREPADLMTPTEAADYLRLPSVRALYQLVRRGRVHAQRLGRQLRFSRKDLTGLART